MSLFKAGLLSFSRPEQTSPTGFTLFVRALFFVIASSLIAIPCSVASFECAQTLTKIEKLICNDRELSALDEQLNAAYTTSTKSSDSSSALKVEQRKWLVERNRCADTACIKRAYTVRLAQLQQADAKSVAPKIAALSKSPEPWEAACPAPHIDWRNYEWTIIVGNGRAACEEMLGYLRSQPADQPPPVCPRERLPPNGHWTRPDWQEPPEPLRSELIKDLAAHGHDLGPQGTVYIARADITRDGIPETILAQRYKAEIAEEACMRAAHCAANTRSSESSVRLNSGGEEQIYAMNEEGTAIDWSRVSSSLNMGLLYGGELVYYKGAPYWLSGVRWDQEIQDDFTKFRANPNDQYSAIFRLSPLAFGSQGLHRQLLDPIAFSQATRVTALESATCYFGYFHHDNLKLHPPRRR